ncbi:MAG: type I methionyl aminopeptidase [Chloroflexi bacterium]|nr:type I methionyl aminopeptidase [Chloroflexota bacterium]MCL5074951.1 type I methionyl aminopeptidase [Chloroflexota bacterium]
MAAIIKSGEELALMRQAGRIVAITLALLQEKIRPGISTAELDAIVNKSFRKQGAIPSFKGYNGFPASLCVSINEEVVHGPPSRRRVLREGDIVGLDLGAIYNGLHADAAITVPVGQVSEEAKLLLETTEKALYMGIAQAIAGKRLSDISWAIQSYVESHGFSVVRQYVGHGIGRSMHEEPQIPNFGPPNHGPVLRPGMTLAIEPMVNAGRYETMVLDDKWTVITQDRSLSAHFEHTIAVTDGEPQILTRP